MRHSLKMDPLAVLLQGNDKEIRQMLLRPEIDLATIDATFREYQQQMRSYQSISPSTADMILDVMSKRFDYRDNEYPFLTVVYALGHMKRFDEFILPDTNSLLIKQMKTTYF